MESWLGSATTTHGSTDKACDTLKRASLNQPLARLLAHVCLTLSDTSRAALRTSGRSDSTIPSSNLSTGPHALMAPMACPSMPHTGAATDAALGCRSPKETAVPSCSVRKRSTSSFRRSVIVFGVNAARGLVSTSRRAISLTPRDFGSLANASNSSATRLAASVPDSGVDFTTRLVSLEGTNDSPVSSPPEAAW